MACGRSIDLQGPEVKRSMAVESRCIHICRFDGKTGLCMGSLREKKLASQARAEKGKR
jgi:hypothetical protein